MNLPLAIRLGGAEVRAHPMRASILVLALALALAVPGLVLVGGATVERALHGRAASTPLVVGPRGSPYETVFAALYFRGEPPRDGISGALVAPLSARGLAAPLVLGQRAAGRPLIGTTLDYLELRGLRLASGRAMAVPGEIVVGADVAASAGLVPGDRLTSDWTGLPDLAGAAVELVVVGVLAPAGSPDDEVIFTDVLTIRAIEGHLHAHVPAPAAGDAPAEARGAPAEPSASAAAVFLTDDLRPETVHRFHLHGDPEALPVSAIVVAPRGPRERDRILGDLVDDPSAQAIEPSVVVGDVLAVLVRVRAAAAGLLGLLGVGTAALVGSVLVLAARGRQRELALLRRLGAGRSTVVAVVAAEAVGLVALALALAGAAVLGGVLWLGA